MRSSKYAWSKDYENVLALARDMVRAGWLTDADAVLEYFEKPWHWTNEYNWWQAAGRPDTRDAWEQGAWCAWEVTT